MNLHHERYLPEDMVLQKNALVAARHVADHGQNAVAANYVGQMSIPLLNGLLLNQLWRERLLQKLLSLGLALCLCNLALRLYLGLLQFIFGLLGALLRYLLLFDRARVVGRELEIRDADSGHVHIYVVWLEVIANQVLDLHANLIPLRHKLLSVVMRHDCLDRIGETTGWMILSLRAGSRPIFW